MHNSRPIASLLALSGGAYIYTSEYAVDGWSNVQFLRGNDTALGDQFGRAVAIYGPLIFVGAPLHEVSDLSKAG